MMLWDKQATEDRKMTSILEENMKKEVAEGSEDLVWMSFVDSSKPKGERSLGVIITKSFGMAHAIFKINELGINPGGEVRGCTTNDIKDEHLDKLLSRDDLKEYGYID